MTLEFLQNRSLVRISGDDSTHFLENLFTCDVAGLDTGQSRFGSLLTPQGKILFDFFLLHHNDGFVVDISTDLAAEFVKRMLFYRLRAKVEIENPSPICVALGANVPSNFEGLCIKDPRNDDLGYRAYMEKGNGQPANTYKSRRIDLGIPEGGLDFQYGDAYPHETLMDQFGGVDFKKGCFVGQEVVSRMQHRGTAKKRIVQVYSESSLPTTGTPIIADGKPAGTIGSVTEGKGLALLRLDRVAKASKIEAGEIEIKAKIPEWVDFNWPQVS